MEHKCPHYKPWATFELCFLGESALEMRHICKVQWSTELENANLRQFLGCSVMTQRNVDIRVANNTEHVRLWSRKAKIEKLYKTEF